jgi:hypothetical protein
MNVLLQCDGDKALLLHIVSSGQKAIRGCWPDSYLNVPRLPLLFFADRDVENYQRRDGQSADRKQDIGGHLISPLCIRLILLLF